MMASFINTIDSLGDMATADAIVNRTIAEFNDDVLTSIGTQVFRDCRNLTSVNIPNVTSIGNGAFTQCRTLTSVNMPNVTSIGFSTFQYCYKLESANMPNVTSIKTSAFSNCIELGSVRLPATPPTLSNAYVFQSVPTTCKFYVPTGSLSTYKSATNWSSITSQYSFVEEDR